MVAESVANVVEARREEAHSTPCRRPTSFDGSYSEGESQPESCGSLGPYAY